LDNVSTVQVSGVLEEEDQAQAHLLSSGRAHSLVCGATILGLWYTAECMQKLDGSFVFCHGLVRVSTCICPSAFPRLFLRHRSGPRHVTVARTASLFGH